MSTIDFLHFIREYELELAIKKMPLTNNAPLNLTLLELGAGTGHQAKILSNYGLNIIALDVKSSAYRNDRVFPVIEYNGNKIPLENATVDLVFTSNVLEHIENLDYTLEEIKRVLTPDGLAIHVLPTSSCRFWSTVTHYGWLIKKTFIYLFMRNSGNNSSNEVQAPKNFRDLIKTIFPSRHGERGNAITEIYYYSEHWWKKKFISHGYTITNISGNGIFYTMANLTQFSINIKLRKLLSILLGSSCKIYTMKK